MNAKHAILMTVLATGCGPIIDDGDGETMTGDGDNCPVGQLNCACDSAKECEPGLVCVESNDGASNICAPSAATDPCEHLTGLDLPGVIVGTGCVAGCVQGDSCGWLECSPIDAFADGFCAWPG